MHHADPALSAELHQAIDAMVRTGGAVIGRLYRFVGVLLVAEGRSCKEVSAWLGVDRRSVQRWVHEATAGPLLPTKTPRCGGRPTRLSARQLDELVTVLRLPPAAAGYPDRTWSGKRLALHLMRSENVVISVRSCQRLIARCRAPTGPRRSSSRG